ncbi:MAG: VWA domain-containing protein [Ruminobacter sp.]|nr:VWA domain-containing protein [Ruminobacter sp.]
MDTTLTFESSIWWVFLILMLLPIGIRFLPGKSKKDEFIYITSLPHHLPSEPKKKIYLILSVAYSAWIFLMIALMRPVYHDKPIIISTEHNDFILAIDLSDSMEIKDMYDKDKKLVTRLSVVKNELKDFIHHRIRSKNNDRIGVILFADNAYILTPLTFDRQLVLDLIDEIDLSLAGQLTNISDAINLAIQRFDEAKTNKKIMILLSDGKNTTDGMNPLEAANSAKDAGMKIYTIGFGGGSITINNRNTKDILADTSADLDETTLRAIAETTDGIYYRARDAQSLQSKYREISFLEPSENSVEHHQPKVELYHWPLLISLILSVATGIIVRRVNG